MSRKSKLSVSRVDHGTARTRAGQGPAKCEPSVIRGGSGWWPRVIYALAVAESVISVRGLRKSYGDLEAVRGIDLEVRAGEVFAFLGPNGAGKTTTVEIL